ncbi:MAG: HAD family hydrolase [Bacteroidota bacterium]
MKRIQLVVMDMAGTTVQDHHEVEKCFAEAAHHTGLRASAERILAVQGLAKRFVFEMLWQEQLLQSGGSTTELERKVEHSYQVFKSILENHYRTQPVLPTIGCVELFAYLKNKHVKIALTTGFYRQVTNIILHKLGWDTGLDEQYAGGSASLIDLSIASDEVVQGRPSPLMIQRAMQVFGITDPQCVINIGDTPSDLESGKRAACYRSLGLTNGTHTRAQLAPYPNDGLFESLTEFRYFLEAEVFQQKSVG